MTHNIRRNITIAAALFFVLLIALFVWLQKSPLKTMTMPQLLASYQDELQLPGPTIAQAATHLENAEAAYHFVRDDIALASYGGRQQSPEDVLQTRFANLPDKAALLAELLQAQGWETKLLSASGYYEPSPITRSKKPRKSKILREILRRLDIDQKTYQADWQNLMSQSQDWLTAQNEQTKTAFDTLKELIGYSESYAQSGSGPNYGDRLFVRAEKDDKTKLFNLITTEDIPEEDLYNYDLPERHSPVIELRLRHKDGLEQTLLRHQQPIANHQFIIRFLPTIAPLERLAGPAEPQTIRNWTPVFIYDGIISSGIAFSLDGDTPSLDDSPPIMDPQALRLANPDTASALEITRVDIEDWPKIRLSLKLDSDGEGVWLPSHFTIRDNGELVKPRLLNINQDQKKLLVLTDVSHSMGDIGAFDISKEAIIDLIRQLPPEMPVGLSSFAGEVAQLIPLKPLDDKPAYERAVNAMEMQSYTGIYRALANAAGVEKLQNGIVILLTDGYDNVGGSEEEVIEALKARNIRVFAIALGNDSDAALLQRIAEKTGGSFQKIRTAEELESFYARLGAELTSYVVLEYEATPSVMTIAEETPLLERFQDKWIPVIRPETRQNKDLEPGFDSIKTEQALEETLMPDADAMDSPDDTDPTPAAAENETSATIEEGVTETPPLEDDATASMGSNPEGTDEQQAPSAPLRQINVQLQNSPLQAQAGYRQPDEQRLGEIAELILRVEYNVGDFQEINRVLLDFSDPDLAWKLTGEYRLVEDLAPYPGSRLEAAYIANWQKAWAMKTGQEDYTSPMGPLDYSQMLLINGFRVLSRYAGEVPTYLAHGPNLYLTRNWITPQNGGTARQIFDVLYRYDRADGGQSTWDEMAMDMASARAEGIIIDGDNGIDILQERADSLQIFSLDEPRPDWVKQSLWRAAIAQKKDYDYLIASPEAPNWVWQANAGLNHEFRTLYDGGHFIAKGSSAQDIARQFEQMDKMLQLYESTMGNFAGLIPTTGAQLSAIASFKRTELKLWCFSTIMMGYVADSIGDEDALLNQQGAEFAKSEAARLCKIKGGSPDNGQDFITNAAKQAVKDGVNSFITNATKEAAGSNFSNAHSLWDTGGKLSGAAATFNFSPAIDGVTPETPAGPSRTVPTPPMPPMPMTSRFHRAMADALEKASP